jgi:hypothetical protein
LKPSCWREVWRWIGSVRCRKLAELRLGLPVNFNVALLKDGIRRIGL